MTVTNHYDNPDKAISFNIYQANGKRKEGLKKAFVEIKELFGSEDTVKLADNSVWPIYYESPINMAFNSMVKHIISFQVYENGDYFAVARLYKDKDTVSNNA